MAKGKSNLIKAIELARGVFESEHGNLELLKFHIEEIMPTNGKGNRSKKWRLVCSFYDASASKFPSKYEVEVNLNGEKVTIRKTVEGDSKTPGFRVIEPAG